MQTADDIKLDDVDGLRAALASVARSNNPDVLIEMVVALLVRLSGENKRLTLRLQKALRSLHGRKSEKLTAGQLALFRELIEHGESAQAEEKKNNQEQEEPDKKSKKGGKGRPHGRGKLPAHLPRVDNIINVPEGARTCPICGSDKQCIGYEISERLDYVAASLRVLRDMREKIACKPCQGQVDIAPTADKVTEGGMAAEGLLAHVLTSKYIDGLTLTRLSKIYAREGVRLAESTLADFVRQATEALVPVARHIEQQVLAATCINQDDTGLRVLDRDHPKGIKRGHIWVFVGGRRWAAYRYAPDWQGEYPMTFLADYKGFIQGDGYAGINGLFTAGDGGPTRVGCWMHCRRYFFDAHKAGDSRAGIPLAYIHDIYEIESRAKEDDAGAAQRLSLRRDHSLPLVERLRSWLRDVEGRAPPKTPLGKALTYANNQWSALMVPFSDGRLELDNGEAERRLKLLATGRKNWLFAGSDKGGERAAVALTVLGTAVLQGVDPLAYVTDVLRKIAGAWPKSRIGELTPLRWAEQEGQQVHAHQPAIPRLVQ